MTEKNYEILGLETDNKAKSQHNMYFSWLAATRLTKTAKTTVRSIVKHAGHW